MVFPDMFGLLNFPLADLILAYQQSDAFGKLIVIVQFGLSAVALSVMLAKFKNFRRMLFSIDRFRKMFGENPRVLNLYRAGGYTENPAEIIYQCACGKIVDLFGPAGLEGWANGDDTVTGLAETELEVVRASAENTLSEQEVSVEGGMDLIAIAVTASPLLGLLGTVVGVLGAFQSMGRSGSALLSDVAPGISSAMLTTVVGLCVAIPTSIAYNVLQSRIKAIQVQLEGFTDDLKGRIGCEFKQR